MSFTYKTDQHRIEDASPSLFEHNAWRLVRWEEGADRTGGVAHELLKVGHGVIDQQHGERALVQKLDHGSGGLTYLRLEAIGCALALENVYERVL